MCNVYAMYSYEVSKSDSPPLQNCWDDVGSSQMSA